MAALQAAIATNDLAQVQAVIDQYPGGQAASAGTTQTGTQAQNTEGTAAQASTGN